MTSTWTERFNASIRAAMATYGITQEEIGAVLGLPRASIGHRLTGKSRWVIPEIEALTAFFDVAPGAVFLGPSAWVSSDPEVIAEKVASLRKGAVTGQYTQDEAAIGPGGYRLSPGVPGQMALSDAVA